MSFLFLDECSLEQLDLAALTGILVPAQVYNTVRDAMCRITWAVLAPPEHVIPQPIELHGANLLNNLTGRDREALDADRLRVFSSVVDVVNMHDLHVYRVAYLNRGQIASRMQGDPMLYGLNFFGMQALLQEELARSIILPVMDGIPAWVEGKKAPQINTTLLRAFDRHVRFVHHMRCDKGMAESISIANVSNLAEPVFADSQHSTLLQLADLVSYLLLQIERDELAPTPSPSPFRAELLRIARSLRNDLVRAWRGKMQVG